MKKNLFFIFLLGLNLQILAQVAIQGTVRSAADGSTLPGVSILLKGTTTGTTTDVDGHYSISIPKNGTLIFSYVGFESREIQINGREVIDVKLSPKKIGLNEVVVVGYGTQKRSLVTGAISSIGPKDIKTTGITQAAQALQYAPGVQVISNSGSPGSPIRVRIRGFSSNNSSSPIFIVDGVKTSIDNLNPNDIQSIEVLKDAASSAIYGAEGGNGVVIITTKTGKKGKTRINYDFQYSWQSVRRKMSLLTTPEYATYMKEAGKIQNVDQTYNTDWQKELFTQAPMQKHHLSFSGGTDKSDYYLSLSYLDQDGIVYGPHDFYKRLNATETSNYHIKKWIKVGNTFLYSNTKHGAIDEENGEFGGVISDAMMIDPATPVEYKGSVPPFVQDLIDDGEKLVKSPDGNYYGISQYVPQEIMNPFVKLAITNGDYKENHFMGMAYIEITPIKGLKITSRSSLDVTYGDWHNWSPTYYYDPSNNNSTTIVSSSTDKWLSWMWENFASYKRKIGHHAFGLVLGTSAEDHTHHYLAAQGGPMIMELPSYARLDYISSQENDQVNGSFDEQRLLSYFGRINYRFKDKYLFEASLRRDGAGLSQLPKEGRWGMFPAVSGGWVISNESFFPKKDKGINFLKLRASWGENGSLSNLGGYSYASLIRSTFWGITMRYPLTDNDYSTVYEPSQLPNPDLRWETSIQTDFGLDLHAFNNHLNFSVDYYRKVTNGLITQNTPPFEAGNNAAPINAGDVLNRGFEVALGYHNQAANNKLKYSANVDFSTLHNEVTYLNPQLHRLYGATVGTGWTATVFSKGYPVWYFYGYKTNGINKQTGDPNFVDVNGDGEINSNDKTYIGSPIPKVLFGGNFNVTYKHFSLSLILEGAAGNKVLMGWIRPDVPTMNIPSYFFKNRWTTQNTNGTMPKAGTDPKTWNSDLLVFDASYLNFQQIQLGYEFSPALLQKMKFSSFRVYLSLNNFFIITNYPGLTPEVGTNTGENNNYGIDHGTYPMSRSAMLGLSFSL